MDGYGRMGEVASGDIFCREVAHRNGRGKVGLRDGVAPAETVTAAYVQRQTTTRTGEGNSLLALCLMVKGSRQETIDLRTRKGRDGWMGMGGRGAGSCCGE